MLVRVWLSLRWWRVPQDKLHPTEVIFNFDGAGVVAYPARRHRLRAARSQITNRHAGPSPGHTAVSRRNLRATQHDVTRISRTDHIFAGGQFHRGAMMQA